MLAGKRSRGSGLGVMNRPSAIRIAALSARGNSVPLCTSTHFLAA